MLAPLNLKRIQKHVMNIAVEFLSSLSSKGICQYNLLKLLQDREPLILKDVRKISIQVQIDVLNA